jgi:hypothetical protein
MGRFLSRAALFVLPFVVLALAIGVIDPFDCLGASSLVPEAAKAAAAEPLHNPLWKIVKFSRHPASRIILGDSSVGALDVGQLHALTGDDYFNLSYGGGTLAESIDTYWLAAAKVHLDAVYIGIGLINFNEYQNLNRVPEAQELATHPLKYLTNRIVLGAAFSAVYLQLTGRTAALETPPMTRAQFWQYQLDEAMPQLLHRYRYPEEFAKKLLAIAADCRAHGTKLVVIVPPIHVDLQEKIVALGRGPDDVRFRAFIRQLGTVCDMDYANAFTENRDNFSDPFHTYSDATLIAEVWGHRGEFSRCSSGAAPPPAAPAS